MATPGDGSGNSEPLPFHPPEFGTVKVASSLVQSHLLVMLQHKHFLCAELRNRK